MIRRPHTGGRPRIYSYPEKVGEITVNPVPDKKRAKRIMSNASERAKYFSMVYRCKHRDGLVYIRRAA